MHDCLVFTLAHSLASCSLLVLPLLLLSSSHSLRTVSASRQRLGRQCQDVMSQNTSCSAPQVTCPFNRNHKCCYNTFAAHLLQCPDAAATLARCPSAEMSNENNVASPASCNCEASSMPSTAAPASTGSSQAPQTHSKTNAVGALQEACTRLGMAPPLYRHTRTSGQSHSPTHEVSLRVNDVTYSGHGRTLKEAKQVAASAALSQLRQ